MTDISLNDLNNSDLRIATSVVRDVKDADSQPWEYQVDDIGAAGGLDSGASSLHEGDTQERQVSAEPASFVLVFRSTTPANIFGEGVSRMGSTIVSLVELGACTVNAEKHSTEPAWFINLSALSMVISELARSTCTRLLSRPTRPTTTCSASCH